jgi:hypothetical protein
MKDTHSEIVQLQKALRECADSLATEIEARYGFGILDPAANNRYEQDMEPVRKARRLLGEDT